MDKKNDGSGRSEQITKFLIRQFCAKFIDESFEELLVHDQTTQTLIFQKWSRVGHGPKLYGCFRGGRLEEYIPSHTLTDDDLADPVIREQFARKLAHYHYMDVPINKMRKKDDFAIAIPLLEASESQAGREHHEKLRKLANIEETLKLANNFDWRAEMDYCRRLKAKVQSAEVLAWNDTNRQNTLIREGHVDKDGYRVAFIDLELTSRNPRGCDFGNHFLFWYFTIDVPTRTAIGYPSEAIR